MDYTGVPTYTLTLSRELVKRGHSVKVYCPTDGPLSDIMHNCTELSNIEVPDVILGQGAKTTRYMKEQFPNIPMIFINHGVLPDEEQPPRFHIDRYIAINEQSVNLLTRQYVDPDKIDIVRDFIDIELYKGLQGLQTHPRVLFLSNYRKWKTYDVIEGACKKLGLEFRAVGSNYGRSRDVATEINNSDIVIGWGRSILEGMACGRAVISFNRLLGDGYLDTERYIDSRQRNFGGFECRYTFTADQMAEELSKYKQEDGLINRDLVVKYHDSVKCTDQILEVINKII